MLARRARTSKSWDHVFNFRTCDVALSSLITFNRPDASTCATRRRVLGAVGPSRTLLGINSATFTGWGAADTGGGFGAYVTAPDGTNTAREWTVPTATGSYAFGQVSVTADASGGAVWGIWARLQSGSASLRLNISDVNIVARTSPNFTVDTTWRYLEFDSSTVGALNNTGNLGFGFTGTGLTGGVTKIEFWHPVAALGRVLGPYIETAGSNVTTTDWPRENLLGSHDFNWTAIGATASYYDGLRPDGTWGRITRATFLGGNGNSVMFFVAGATQIASDYGISIFAKRVSGGNQFGLNLESSTAQPAAGNHFGSVVTVTDSWSRVQVEGEITAPVSAPIVFMLGFDLRVSAEQALPTITVDFCFPQAEYGRVTSLIRNGVSSVAPPYGQMTTVAANVPQMEYDKDGIGRGLRVDGAAAQLLATTKGFNANWIHGPTPGWQDNYGVAPDGTVTTTFAVDNSTAYENVAATIDVPLKFSVFVRAGTAPYYRLYADGAGLAGSAYIDRAFGTNTVIGLSGPVTASGVDGDAVDGMQRVWFEVTPTATGSIAFHIYPISGTAEFWGANVTTGNLTGYIEGQHTRAAASALMVPSTVGLTPTSGSILIDCEVTNTNTILWQLGASSSDQLQLTYYAGAIRVYSYRAGVEELAGPSIGAPSAPNNRARVIVAWASGKIYACVNGGEPSTFNAGVPTSFADLALSYYPYGGGYQVDGLIRELRTASRTLTIAELVRESAL